jgi:site-specific DNA-cytosine methylase
VEKDAFCRSVLAKNWPNASQYDDITTLAALPYVDIIACGFPCQPVSLAGKRRAQKDARWLWPHVARIVNAVRPKVVVLENVLGLRTAGLRDVLSDLAASRYDAEWEILSAFDVGAPHLRKRIFIVAYADGVKLRSPVFETWAWHTRTPEHRCVNTIGTAADTDRARRLQSARRLAESRGWPKLDSRAVDISTPLDVGLTGKLVASRRALGNAVVPACAFVLGRAIKESVCF